MHQTQMFVHKHSFIINVLMLTLICPSFCWEDTLNVYQTTWKDPTKVRIIANYSPGDTCRPEANLFTSKFGHHDWVCWNGSVDQSGIDKNGAYYYYTIDAYGPIKIYKLKYAEIYKNGIMSRQEATLYTPEIGLEVLQGNDWNIKVSRIQEVKDCLSELAKKWDLHSYNYVSGNAKEGFPDVQCLKKIYSYDSKMKEIIKKYYPNFSESTTTNKIDSTHSTSQTRTTSMTQSSHNVQSTTTTQSNPSSKNPTTNSPTKSVQETSSEHSETYTESDYPTEEPTEEEPSQYPIAYFYSDINSILFDDSDLCLSEIDENEGEILIIGSDWYQECQKTYSISCFNRNYTGKIIGSSPKIPNNTIIAVTGQIDEIDCTIETNDCNGNPFYTISIIQIHLILWYLLIFIL